MSAMFENINISKAAISMMADLRVKDDRYEIYDLEMEGFVLSVTYLNPNKCTRGHKHDYEEAYYFAQGCGRVKLDRRIVNVKSGDLLRIPPNTFHRVFNDGDLHRLTFVCAFSRRNKKELLQAMGGESDRVKHIPLCEGY